MYFTHSPNTLFTQRLAKCVQKISSSFFPIVLDVYGSHFIHDSWIPPAKHSSHSFHLSQRVKGLLKKRHWCAVLLLSPSAGEAPHATHQPADQLRRQRVSPSSNRIALFPLLPPSPIALTALCIKPSLNCPCSVRRRPVNLNEYFSFSDAHEHRRALGVHTPLLHVPLVSGDFRCYDFHGVLRQRPGLWHHILYPASSTSVVSKWGYTLPYGYFGVLQGVLLKDRKWKIEKMDKWFEM